MKRKPLLKKTLRAGPRKSLKGQGRFPRTPKGQKHAILPRPLAFASVRVRLVTFAEAKSEPQLLSFTKELTEKLDAMPVDAVAAFVEKRTAKGRKVRGRPVNVEKIKLVATLEVSGLSKGQMAKIVCPNALDPSKQFRTYFKKHKEEIEAEILSRKQSQSAV